MRHLFACSAVCLLAVASSPGDRPSFHVAPDSRVTKTFEEKLEMKLEALHVWAGDEEVPQEELGDFGLEIESTDTRVFTDHYLKVSDGEPLELERKFDELGVTGVERASGEDVGDDGEGPAAEREHTRERKSELEGKTIVFRREEPGAEPVVAFKGDEGDKELLEHLEEDTDLRAFLPTKAVAEDDTWEVDVKAFNAIATPGGDLKLVATEEEDDPVDRQQLSDNVNGRIVATYAGRREVGGLEVDVISLAMEVKTHADDEGGMDEGNRKRHFEFAHDLKGELLWSVELGRAHALLLEGRTEVKLIEEATFEGDEGEFHFKQDFTFAGTVRFEAKFEKAQ